MTRKTLGSVCVGLVGLLLFGQLAIAAYMCPGLQSEQGMNLQTESSLSGNGGTSSHLTSFTGDAAINCDEMAAQQSAPASNNLCVEHCRYGQQSDQTSTIVVPTALLNVRYSAPLLLEPALFPRKAAADTNSRVATGPPHAILHCCFRI